MRDIIRTMGQAYVYFCLECWVSSFAQGLSTTLVLITVFLKEKGMGGGGGEGEEFCIPLGPFQLS